MPKSKPSQAADAIKLKDDPNILLVDIRDIRELDRDGRIPGALHAPRGMLEFWVDPGDALTIGRFLRPARSSSSSERAEADLRWQRRPFSRWDWNRSRIWAAASTHGKPPVARSILTKKT